MAAERASSEDPWAFAVQDLSPFGLARIREDYDGRERFAAKRTGGTGMIARYDFAAGWMAAMVRISQWSYFTDDGRRRLEGRS